MIDVVVCSALLLLLSDELLLLLFKLIVNFLGDEKFVDLDDASDLFSLFPFYFFLIVEILNDKLI